jgi:hypothetical protein
VVISDESQNSPNPLSPIRSCRQTDLCPCSLSCSSPLVENRSTHPHPRGTKLVRKKGGQNGGEEEEGRCQEEEVQFRRVCPHRGRHLRLRDPAGACPTTQHNAFRFLHPLSTSLSGNGRLCHLTPGFCPSTFSPPTSHNVSSRTKVFACPCVPLA